MDKYEYKVREEEIRKLIANRDFVRAVEIADTIDWRRVKSIKTLCTISDLYKINKRYQESKEILLMAYERYPGGRLIVYSLCELSIKLEEYVQAIEYYKEYVQLAPKDTNRYILQYKIYESQDVPLEERAEVLEEFKRKDYREKWAYELANLYHKMGLSSKCVDECDELIVTFGEGKYVIKAMDLKKLHTPLSAYEQAKYDEWMSGGHIDFTGDMPTVVEDTGEIGQTEPVAEPVSVTAPEPVSETPQEMDIQVKTVDVGQYNTTNLQEALAESMKDIWGTDEPITPPSRPEANIDDNTFYGTGPLAGPEYSQEEVEEVADTATEPEPPVEEAPAVNIVSTPVSAGMVEQSITYESEDLLSEETKRIPTEAVVDYLEAERLREQMRIQSASMNTPTVPAPEVVEDHDSTFDNILAQESDGQISLALPDSEQLEKQITGQLSIEDVLAEWENAKKENEEKRKQEVKQRILQHTGSLFDEFDEDTKASLLEQLERAFRDAIDKEAKSGKVNSDELGERIHAEAQKAVEILTKDGMVDEEPTAEVEEEIEPESVEEAEIEDEVEAEDETEAETPEESEDDSDDEFAAVEPSEEDSEEVKAVIKALAEEDEEENQQNDDEDDSDDSDDDSLSKERSLSEDEEKFFAPYLTRKRTRRQITAALDNMSLASYTGNVIVTGEEGVGTIDLAKRLIKQLQSMDANLQDTAAKITGKALNSKDIGETLAQLQNGALIIESARGMKKSTVEKLIKALDKEEQGILVILEDTAEGIDRIVKALPQISTLFNVRIDLHALDDKALVSYAKEYALSQEYSIDEFGILELHARIEERQTSDHQVTVAEVRELVDDAIYYAERKTPAHFFDIIFHKRYDDDDMVILREKDFMHS